MPTRSDRVITDLVPTLTEDGHRVWACVAGIWAAQRRPAHIGMNELSYVRGLVEWTTSARHKVANCWARPTERGRELIVIALLQGWQSTWEMEPSKDWGRVPGEEATWQEA